MIQNMYQKKYVRFTHDSLSPYKPIYQLVLSEQFQEDLRKTSSIFKIIQFRCG